MPSGAGAGSAPAGASCGACAGASTPSTSASSPDSYISLTMSQPPTSSPRTKSCGMVGHWEIAESSWRIRGSGRMSTAAYSVPSASSAADVRAEKPHIGCSGVPFMKRMISWSAIASWMASRTGFSLMASLRSGLEGKGMDGAADLGSEDRVDPAVLLDAAQLGEVRGDHGGAEVVPAAREVADLGARPRDGRLDALLELVRGRHSTTA